jgi:ferric-dicitrate binding protein FerR (iron transport regulator)
VDTENREVWLDGEAYFQVQKKPATHQKFIVHVKNLDVEVLGTVFNINTRHAQSVVSLEEGKVQLAYEEKSITNKELSPAKVVLKPGDVAMVDTISNKLRLIHEKDVTYRSGWSRHEFHFENTPLREIAQLVEKTYGYKMVTEDDSLMNKQLTGDLRAENVQEFVKVLEFALKLKMEIVNKQILVRQP